MKLTTKHYVIGGAVIVAAYLIWRNHQAQQEKTSNLAGASKSDCIGNCDGGKGVLVDKWSGGKTCISCKSAAGVAATIQQGGRIVPMQATRRV